MSGIDDFEAYLANYFLQQEQQNDIEIELKVRKILS